MSLHDKSNAITP